MTRGWKVLALTSVGVYMVALDVSVLNVAFRSLVDDFGLDHRTLLAWVFSGYNIAFAAALLSAGRLADRYGRKRAFLTGVAIFAIGSVLCGVAPTPGLLVAARVLQGLGGALVLPSSLALVLPEFPVERRSAAIGIWGAVGGIAAATGPTVGGVLVEWLGWRSVFFVNAPFCLLAIVIGRRLLQESRDEGALGLPDVVGALLAMFGVGLLTLAVVQGDAWGWGSTRVAGCVVASLVLLAAFVVRCSRHPDPVLDLSLLRLRYFTAANASAFVFSMGFFAMFFTNVQFLQEAWGYSVVKSGLAMTPGPLSAAIVSAPAGRFAHRLGHQRVIVPGLVLFTAGITVLLARAGTQPTYLGLYLPAMVLTGVGVGLAISTLGSASNAYLPPSRFAMGSAFNATCRQVGAALGIAAATALRPTGGDVIVGFRRSWTFIIVCSVAAGAVLVAFYRRPTQSQLAASDVAARPPELIEPVGVLAD